MPEPLCRARWLASGKDKEDFKQKMQTYTGTNLTDGTPNLVEFFQDVANLGVLNLPVGGKDEEDVFESARIYMERSGRPFNYLASEAEVAAEIRETRKSKAEAAKIEAEA